jgi:tRNA (cytidine/uridine-2'-O-)-methyltransferase
VATGAALHLIRPLGFDTDEKACRRAGLDYWPRLALVEHTDWPAYRAAAGTPRSWYFTTKSARPVFDADLRPGDHLIFGSATAGLPDPILALEPTRTLCLPMVPGERSLNLATAVCTVIYEAVRQMLARGEVTLDASGRLILPT